MPKPVGSPDRHGTKSSGADDPAVAEAKAELHRRYLEAAGVQAITADDVPADISAKSVEIAQLAQIASKYANQDAVEGALSGPESGNAPRIESPAMAGARQLLKILKAKGKYPLRGSPGTSSAELAAATAAPLPKKPTD